MTLDLHRWQPELVAQLVAVPRRHAHYSSCHPHRNCSGGAPMRQRSGKSGVLVVQPLPGLQGTQPVEEDTRGRQARRIQLFIQRTGVGAPRRTTPSLCHAGCCRRQGKPPRPAELYNLHVPFGGVRVLHRP